MLISLNNEILFSGFTAYKVIFEGQVIYIGVCKLKELFNLSDAMKNSEFKQKIRFILKFDIEVIYMSLRQEECLIIRDMQIAISQPYCNVYGMTVISAGKVRCIETGEEFGSVKEAAENAFCKPNTMSKHLSRVKGYGTVKGYTFERIKQ